MESFSFSVGLSHPLQCAGLSRRSLSPKLDRLTELVVRGLSVRLVCIRGNSVPRKDPRLVLIMKCNSCCGQEEFTNSAA
jgi:hypothetical protein